MNTNGSAFNPLIASQDQINVIYTPFFDHLIMDLLIRPSNYSTGANNYIQVIMNVKAANFFQTSIMNGFKFDLDVELKLEEYHDAGNNDYRPYYVPMFFSQFVNGTTNSPTNAPT